MAANTEEIKRKYTDIRKEYQDKWLTKTYKGVLIHSDAYMFAKLGEQFYLSPKTIENILYYRIRVA